MRRDAFGRISRLSCATVLSLFALSGAANPATAQSGSTGVLFDRYSFDAGVGLVGLGDLGTVSQVSVPVTVSLPVANRGQLLVSGGFHRVEVSGTGSDNLVVDGITDVETRFSYEVVPGRISAFATASLPTGTQSVESSAAPVLGILVADVLAFTTERLGSGGSGGLGIAGAETAGRFAFGWAASYTAFGSFQPIVDGGNELKPGGEVRVRAGLEGPVGPRTYLRFAGIFARKASDKLGDSDTSRSGNRLSAYASVDQAVGRATVTLYAFDAYRGTPSIEGTAFGPASLPRGNVIAGGGQATFPVTPETTFIPRLELRRSDQSLDPSGSDLTKLGTSLRIGADVRRRLTPRATLVVEADGLFGSVSPALFAPTGPATTAGVTGLRAGAHVSFTW